MHGVTFIRALRHLAIIEGVSTLLLFGIAMPLKYAANMPLAVRIAGSIHGALFIALVLMLLIAIRKVPISFAMAAAGIVAAIVPGGPFFYERRIARLDASRTPAR
jgi:integral membrane protein